MGCKFQYHPHLLTTEIPPRLPLCSLGGIRYVAAIGK